MGKRKFTITLPPSKRNIAAKIAAARPQQIISNPSRSKGKKAERQAAEADINRRLNDESDV